MIHEFTQRSNQPNPKLRVALDMARVDAVLCDEQHVTIVMGSDAYYVTESYAIVLAAWLRARRGG